MIANPIEYLDVRDKVQVNSAVIDDVTPVSIGPWEDSDCKQGLYYMWSDSACYFKHQSTAIVSGVSSSTGILLNAKNPIVIQITEGDYLSVLGDAGATGSVRFVRIKSLL